MRRKNIFYAILVLFLTFVSCDDELIEEVPSEFVSQDRITEISNADPSILDGALSGLYANLYTQGTGGTGSNTLWDVGMKGCHVETDLLTGDMYSFGADWWYHGFASHAWMKDYTFNTNYRVWRYHYRIISQANALINSAGGLDDALKKEVKHKVAQAVTVRAYAYFSMLNYLSRKTELTGKCIPIYKTPNERDVPLSTNKEVYEFIVNDLKTAIKFFDGFTPSVKVEANIDVARFYLAMTYGLFGENGEAVKFTDAIIAPKKYSVMNKTEILEGMNEAKYSGWIWGVDITAEQNMNFNSWWGIIDINSNSYPEVGNYKSINPDLYAKIADDDVRKQWVEKYHLDASGDTTKVDLHTGKFREDRIVGGPIPVVSDLVFLRVAAAYLLDAELNAKLNNYTKARASLKAVLSERLPDADAYIAKITDDKLLDEILLQTRIELYGEGMSYFSMKRNKYSVTYSSKVMQPSTAGKTFASDDEGLTYMIPENEITNNPNITGTEE